MAVFKWVCSVLWLLILCLTAVDGLFGHGVVHCQFSARNGSDALYLEKFYFNKKLMVEYSSATGKFTSYTKETMHYAEEANNNTKIMETQRRDSNHSCFSRVPVVYDALKVTDSEPEQVVKASSAADHADVVCAVGLILGTLSAAGGMFLMVKSGRVCSPSGVL